MEFYEQKKLGLYVLIWIVCSFFARYVFLRVEIYFGFELDSFLSFVLTIFTFEIIARTSSKIAYMRKAAGWLIYEGSCVQIVEPGWPVDKTWNNFQNPQARIFFQFSRVAFKYQAEIRLDDQGSGG